MITMRLPAWLPIPRTSLGYRAVDTNLYHHSTASSSAGNGGKPSPRWRAVLGGTCVLVLLVIVLTAVTNASPSSFLERFRNNPEDVAEHLLEDDGKAYSEDDGSGDSDESSNENGDTSNADLDASGRKRNYAGAVKLIPAESLATCAASRRAEHPGEVHGLRAQYIHVPKAGGTSIQRAMYLWAKKAGAEKVQYMSFDGVDVKGTNDKCPDGAMSHTLLAGHRGFGYCHGVENSDLFTFTALRHPIDRMVSLYDYNLKTRGTDTAQRLFGNSHKSLKELVKRYNATPEIEPGEMIIRYSASQQTRFLCGYRCFTPAGVKNASPLTNDEMFESASKNLLKVDALSVSEKLDELIVQLRYHMPRIIPLDFRQWPHFNVVHTVKSQLDDEARAIMEKWAAVDMKLYEMAKVIAEHKTKCAREGMAKLRQQPPQKSAAQQPSGANEEQEGGEQNGDD